MYQAFEALGSGLVCLLWAIIGDFRRRILHADSYSKIMVSMQNINPSSIQMFDAQLTKTSTDVKTGI